MNSAVALLGRRGHSTASNHSLPVGANSRTTPTGLDNQTSLSALFPVPAISNWTTFTNAPGARPLSDAMLRPFKVESGMTHTYMQMAGKSAMEANYPAGSYIPSEKPLGGFSFYAPGPEAVDLTTAEEATFGYSILFPTGFDFVMGGKLPGIYGGDDATTAILCSGGRRDTSCFSARLMWRTNGAGEIYTYLPDPSATTGTGNYTTNKQLCVKPDECNDTYGASISRSAFTFATGAWTTVSQRVKLNTVGQPDGELELFVDGRSVNSAKGLIIRDSAEGRMRGLQMQTFFGGSTKAWASPRDQKVYFADFSVAITSKL
ncbi:hypothetical protein C8F04DRAFT_980863 [Mycena alexandri]|uniref:Polysaccharide lyase 14 domain-containing protein n=1 Tax=Mycena alexandri TaxID=1745969 RepID=A0AAD6WLD3_9AGAR|nr:hypothetical protein C8F04DRAFT_980863 [Mycena alexandri]